MDLLNGRIDTWLSAPIQRMELGPVDYLLGFPDGELGFGPKKVV